MLLALPTFLSAKNFDITEFGAVADTSALSTQAIQKAIDLCSTSGGGQVTIPAGSFKTGTIILKSNVLLYLENGATLYGSTNLNDYIKLKPAYISLRTHVPTIQLIYAENVENSGISGFGTIDGQGKDFVKLSENDEGMTRPHLLRFITSNNIVVENITLKNSGCWMQHYLACDNVQIRGLRVFNRNNFNNDALDLDGCRNVTVSDLITDSDDDGITLKSTSPRPCENITITNCVVSSRCNAIKLGTETNAGFRNICISNCVVKPSEAKVKGFYGREGGLAGIALEIVDGGIMDGISISNIQIEGTTAPIFIRLGNRARPYKEGVPVENVGKVEDITISNVRAKNTSGIGCSISGLPGNTVNNVRLSNIAIEYAGGGTLDDVNMTVEEKAKAYPESTMFGEHLPAYGFYIRHASGITMDGMQLSTKTEDKRPAIFMDDVCNSNFNNLQLHKGVEADAAILIKDSKDILINNYLAPGKASKFVKLDGRNNIGITINK
jgi:polygalacturonase